MSKIIKHIINLFKNNFHEEVLYDNNNRVLGYQIKMNCFKEK